MTKQLTLAEASAELGISKRTLIRRLNAGTIRGKKVNSRWIVYLDTDSAQVDKTAELENRIQEMEQKVSSLEQRTDWLRGAIETMVYQHRPIWERIFKRKQLPPVVDMEDHDGKR